MKKTIIVFICFVAVFYFTGITKVEAQWSADIYYDTIGCDGWDLDYFDSELLVEDTAELYITMD